MIFDIIPIIFFVTQIFIVHWTLMSILFLPMEEYGCRGPGYDLRRDFYPLVLKFKKLDESLARFEISPLDYLISLVTLFDHITICYCINKIHLSFFLHCILYMNGRNFIFVIFKNDFVIWMKESVMIK